MTDNPVWRRTYDQAERALAPHLEALVRTREFARGAAAALGAQHAVARTATGATGVAWRLLNLPARSDVQRLRLQIGALDRDVRRLSLQLEQAGGGRPGEQS